MNRITASLLAGLALMACNKNKDDTSSDTGAAGDGGDACTTEVTPGYPAAGQADFYYRSPLDVVLTNGESSETFSLTDSAGAEVSGTVDNDGEKIVFIPSAALTPGAAYNVEITTCAASPVSYSFNTSTVGAATDGCDITGQSFAVDLQNARFVEPPGIGELLLDQLEDDIMLSPVSVTDTQIEMIGALGTAGAQDFCTESLNDFPPAAYSDPHFELGPADTPLNVAGVELVIGNLYIAADYLSDCSGFAGGTLAGELDARVLAPVLEDLLGISDPDEICATLTGFGVVCGPCSDGTNYCVDILVDQLNGEGGYTPLEMVTTEDIAANPDCAD
jgi:hypothetical protein